MAARDRSLQRLGERGAALLALGLLVWQGAAGLWREARGLARVAAEERGFALAASEAQRFERLGEVGSAFLLLERFTPRRSTCAGCASTTNSATWPGPGRSTT
jgi:hypothetical protein